MLGLAVVDRVKRQVHIGNGGNLSVMNGAHFAGRNDFLSFQCVISSSSLWEPEKKITIIVRIKTARSIFGGSGTCVPVPVLSGVAVPPALAAYTVV